MKRRHDDNQSSPTRSSISFIPSLPRPFVVLCGKFSDVEDPHGESTHRLGKWIPAHLLRHCFPIIAIVDDPTSDIAQVRGKSQAYALSDQARYRPQLQVSRRTIREILPDNCDPTATEKESETRQRRKKTRPTKSTKSEHQAEEMCFHERCSLLAKQRTSSQVHRLPKGPQPAVRDRSISDFP